MGMKCSFPVVGNLEVIGEIVMLNGTLQALQHIEQNTTFQIDFQRQIFQFGVNGSWARNYTILFNYLLVTNLFPFTFFPCIKKRISLSYEETRSGD